MSERTSILTKIFGFSVFAYIGVGMVHYISWTLNGNQTLGGVFAEYFPCGIDTDCDNAKKALHPDNLMNNLVLLLLFALHHTIFARPAVKELLKAIGIGESLERSLYNFVTINLFHQLILRWQPLPEVMWGNAEAEISAYGGVIFGFVIFVSGILSLDPFDLFGIRQSFGLWKPINFRTPFIYNLIRHPIMTGFLIIFWTRPIMTKSSLLLASVWTAYILIALQFEERDLILSIGDDYVQYRKTTGALIPMCPFGGYIGSVDDLVGRAQKKKE